MPNPATEVTLVQDKVFETVRSATNKMVDFIRPTYGPASNKVIIDANGLYFLAVDDGVQIARDFKLPDPAEMAVVKLVRETAIKTNDRVGDGTTGALIVVQAIINELARRTRWEGHKIAAELKKGMEQVRNALKKSAKPIKTREELKKVAMVSFDNEEIADMISLLYSKLGKDGVITIDKSATLKTTFEIAEGITFNRGYISPYMIMNPERMEAVLEKPHILFTDYRLTEHGDILPIMDKLVKAGHHQLVVVCENMEQSALATAVLNKMQGKFALIAVTAPSEGDRKMTLEDMALLTGGRVFTESKGDKLENAEIKDLGKATRFIARERESIIVSPKGNRLEIAAAVTELRNAVENEQDEEKKKPLVKRLGMFTNSVAVIKVGASTESEQKALKYKVEDAVHAVKAAYKGGVVRGSGLALASVTTSSPLLNEALQRPHYQLLENMGLDTFSSSYRKDEALNVITGERGNFMEVGVVDPVDVLIAGIESAVSIASTLVTLSGILVETPAKADNQG